MVTVSTSSRGPRDGLARLQEQAADGRLDTLCERNGIAVLTVFGSTTRSDAVPRDLDISVLHRPGHRVDYPAVLGDLQSAACSDIDLAVLDDAGPVLRERALVGSVPLYEYQPGEWARAAMAAVLERMDTAWMRRLDLDLLAG
jgi:predicted nucleotidyltransferase